MVIKIVVDQITENLKKREILPGGFYCAVSLDTIQYLLVGWLNAITQ